MKKIIYSILIFLIINNNAVNSGPEIILDSSLTYEEAVLKNLNPKCPASIAKMQALITVKYYSFDNKIHQGQIVADKRLEKDIKIIFKLMLDIKFPVASVIPVSDPKFSWDDDKSMAANNTSGFNYRAVKGQKNLSRHAYGFAVDINPKLNPFIRSSNISPPGASYNASMPGTLHPVVKKFKALGWTWGGDWESLKDYQHFEKVL
ncbi:MAG: M15 family metallopeptidase [Spirochaetes bacterium]|nr:M15 family metallopeptidase [Spirochaetota bacterium]